MPRAFGGIIPMILESELGCSRMCRTSFHAILTTRIWMVSSPAERGVGPKLMNDATARGARLTAIDRIVCELVQLWMKLVGGLIHEALGFGWTTSVALAHFGFEARWSAIQGSLVSLCLVKYIVESSETVDVSITH